MDTPLSAPEKSRERRTAKLKLGEDGTLEGDVRVEYTGPFAIEKRYAMEAESPDKREESVRDGVKRRMSTAEVTNVKIENASDAEKPLICSYHVRVPGCAPRTGKRLFVQPAFFQFNVAPMFATSARKYPIYFSYPWSESDEVLIDVPAGFALDDAEAPSPFKVSDVSAYNLALAITKDSKTLVYRRDFFFKGMLIGAENYTTLKRVFDELNKQDNHAVTLKIGGAAATNANPNAAPPAPKN